MKNGNKSYPIGIFIAIVLGILNYAIPIATGVNIDKSTSFDQWEEGYLVNIAMRIAPWLGTLVLNCLLNTRQLIF